MARNQAQQSSDIAAKPLVWWGLGLAFAVGAVCIGLGALNASIPVMLIAILLGALWRNLAPVPAVFDPGIAVAAKRVLRLGVVLLGLQLSVTQIASLGWGVIVVAVAAVAITFVATLGLGKALGIEKDLRMLMAAGFSICGAAAVAGMQGVTRAKQEFVAAAVAMVVVCGTLMIPIAPLLAQLLGYDDAAAGMFIGGSVHEVAQVVAAGGIAGGGVILSTAVTVKLARVLMLAPMIAAVSLSARRDASAARATASGTGGKVDGSDGSADSADAEVKLPPIMPLFVLGFIVMVVIASLHIVPQPILDVAKIAQTFLLASAMFALGLGVHVKSLMKLGGRPLLLGAGSSVVIILVVIVCIALGAAPALS